MNLDTDTRLDMPVNPPHDRDDAPAALADHLLAYARKASATADRLTPHDGTSRVPGHAVDALAYIRAAREALHARQIADEPLAPGEREATAYAIARLRRDLETVGRAHVAAEQQRDDLAAFLSRLAGEVDALSTPSAIALAGRIRRHLADVLTPDPAEEASGHGG